MMSDYMALFAEEVILLQILVNVTIKFKKIL